MGFLRLSSLATVFVASTLLVPAANGAAGARPPVTWLKGSGNFTPSHRAPESIEKIVVHVTEGAFWGSVQWLKNPRAHASSHYVVSRRGRIVQLVHLSDIAWHAGNWNVNTQSVGIEHEGFTYGPGGFTDAQYRASARLTAWIARRALLPINRRTIIGHAEVPGPGGRLGGSSGHTDPGPSWDWSRYVRLVRRYAGIQKLSVLPIVPQGPLRGVVPWRAKATGDIKRVEFSIDGRVVRVDGRAPFTYSGGLNTTKLGNGPHFLRVHGVAGPGRYDIAGRRVVVDNKAFALTSAGARPWTRVRGPVRLRVRPWGSKAARMVFRVDGRVRSVDRRAPFRFAWNPARAKPGRHLLEVLATSVDGRVATRRIPLVVADRRVVRPKPKPRPTPVATVRIVSQSLTEPSNGLSVWRVEAAGPIARVEFVVDGEVRGSDVAAPYTFGWSPAAETPGQHVLTARAVGKNGKTVQASISATVPAPPETAGTAAP